ncbi:CoA transferase [Streptomyces sp. NPDC056653]|uniref:CoA transferase n=1 Tax=Streptomyces sp. NPDC056653 TaxID=3345894 RepID=UPI00369AD314
MDEVSCMLPLSGVSVVNASGHQGAYLARLLSDLGADTVRLPNDAADAKEPSPFFTVGQQTMPPGESLEGLLERAHLLITGAGPAKLRRLGFAPDTLARRFPRLVHVALSPYGQDGPHADRPATDLTVLAAGGLLALSGDPDRPPVRPVGEQSAIAASLHAGVGALIALLVLEETGEGQQVDVSAQEAVAHSLENAAQYFDLEGVVRRRTGSASAEAANGLFACADGWVYLVAGIGGSPLGWTGLVTWLEGAGLPGASQLRAGRWEEHQWRRTAEAAAEFRLVFEGFARERSKQVLYEEGQRHGVSIAPVSTPGDLLTSPQLVERNFFRTVQMDGEPVLVPGSPYRFRGLDVGPGRATTPRADKV